MHFFQGRAHSSSSSSSSLWLPAICRCMPAHLPPTPQLSCLPARPDPTWPGLAHRAPQPAYTPTPANTLPPAGRRPRPAHQRQGPRRAAAPVQERAGLEPVHPPAAAPGQPPGLPGAAGRPDLIDVGCGLWVGVLCVCIGTRVGRLGGERLVAFTWVLVTRMHARGGGGMCGCGCGKGGGVLQSFGGCFT